jgi:hypothetical protein
MVGRKGGDDRSGGMESEPREGECLCDRPHAEYWALDRVKHAPGMECQSLKGARRVSLQ